MAPIPDMETLAARLASFDTVLPAPKRRGSNVKGQKSISWPHRNPKPEDLAEAGLYYNPSAANPDNTSCFLCEKQLAGWEEDDKPVAEHLKLSSDCGWAIIKHAGPQAGDVSTMEDPTHDRLFEARKATFGSRWPHEHKRGWVCKTEKMAAAGWHFAPTAESEDFVSCAYCKLSLDGWEPKDCPFDEHHRRSPRCAFFVFAGNTAPKTGRGKKARVSKASRLSTQSNVTNASQVQSIPDLNDSIDVSNISQDTVLSTVSMASKKAGKGKGRSTRTKNTEPIEVADSNKYAAEEVVVEIPGAMRRGTKRNSEDISEDHRSKRESTVKPEPPPKRRATRSRNSESQQVDYPVLDAFEDAEHKPGRGNRKRASSRSRKVSTASVATTASLRAAIPDDAEIEAALEADFDKAMPDVPPVASEATDEAPKPKTRGRTKKTNASTAPVRSTRQATAESESSQKLVHELEEHVPASEVEKESKAASKGKGRKPRVTKKTVSKKPTQADRVSDGSTVTLAPNAESQLNSSLLTAQTVIDDSGHETDASIASQKSVARKGSKKKGNAKAKGKKIAAMSKNIEDIVQTRPASQSVAESAPAAEADQSLIITGENPVRDHVIDEEVGAEKPKRITRTARGKMAQANTTAKAKTKFPQQSMPGMFSPLMGEMEPSFNSVLATSSPPVAPITRSGLGADSRIPVTLARKSSPRVPEPVTGTESTPTITRSIAAAKPTPTPQRSKNTNEATPSPSPQSSDAENQPPSSRPPSVRPPLASLSPTKATLQRIPLAPGTPRQVPLSPSKIGGLRSEMPWTAVDVEMIFAPSPDKENRNIFASMQYVKLTSPERAMSVEEWVRAQATAAEETLKAEAERVVSIFEREGGRALGVLEGIDAAEY